jgi:hypothetical protein
MALTLPKLAVPKLALNKKQLPAIVGGVLVLAAAGWFGWQYFSEEAAPPTPAKKPQAVTAAKPPAAANPAAPASSGMAPAKQAGNLLAAAGMLTQLTQLPQKLLTGVQQSAKQQTKASPAVLKAIENAVAESFSAENFYQRVVAALTKDFDEKRVQALLKDYSTPAAKRMVALEQAPSSQEEFAQFARSPAATRPSPQRVSLIKRIDTASRAGDLAVDIAFASMKAVALGVVGEGAGKAAAVDKAIESQRASATQKIHDATLLNLAFSYRGASDAELEEYAKFYETENSKWFSGIVYASLLEEMKSASAQAGERIASLANRPALPAAQHPRSKSRADARACLDLAGNAAIIKCAEGYR